MILRGPALWTRLRSEPGTHARTHARTFESMLCWPWAHVPQRNGRDDEQIRACVRPRSFRVRVLSACARANGADWAHCGACYA